MFAGSAKLTQINGSRQTVFYGKHYAYQGCFDEWLRTTCFGSHRRIPRGHNISTLTMKRLITTIALSLLLTLPLAPIAPRVQAATNWVDGGYAEEMHAARTTGSVSQSPYTVRSFDTPMYSIIEKILGPVPGITVTADIMQKDPKYVQEMNQKSAVTGIGNYIAMIYANPPADLALWIRDTGQTLGFLPKQAYAQGVGFSGLAPLLPIWKAFRNIAYLLLAIVMIVIGFMVMLRKKIDPKTVVTVQNALPQIVITLLLITFSYAIVGVLIDIMYIVLVMGMNLLVNSSAGALGQDAVSKYLNNGAWELLGGMFWGGMSSFDDVVRIINPFGLAGTSADTVASLLLKTGGSVVLSPLLAATGILIILLLGIFLLIGYIRVLMMLIMAYINILISIIFAPLQLLAGAFPGSNSFTSWLLNIVANLVIFPVTAIMILIGTILTRNNAVDMWTPPLLASPGGNTSGGWVGLIGIGIILSIPSIANSIKEALKAKPLVPVSGGGAMGAVSTVGGLVVQYGMGKIQMRGLIQNQEKWQKHQESLAVDRGGPKDRHGG